MAILFTGQTFTRDNLREKTSWFKEKVLKKPVTIAAKFLKKSKKVNDSTLRSVNYDSRDWNKTRELDVTEVGFPLPSGFKAPKNLKSIVVKHDQVESGLIQDPQLQRSLPRNVKVKVMTSTKDIYQLLTKDPSKLTLGMAKVITGERNIAGTKPLSPLQIAALVDKLNKRPDQGLPKKEVLEYLVKYPLDKLNPDQRKVYIQKVNSYKNLLKVLDPNAKVVADRKLNSREKQEAIKKAKQIVVNQANEIINEGQDPNQHLNPKLGLKVVKAAKDYVSRRAHEQSGKFLPGIVQGLDNESLNFAIDLIDKNYQGNAATELPGYKNIVLKIQKAYIESVRSIENNFEKTDNAKRIEYKRATAFEEGSTKLVHLYNSKLKKPAA